MGGITRFGISIDSALIRKFDALIAKKGYGSRSRAIQELVREKLIEDEWNAGDRETVGTITLVYDHHTRELEHALTEMQHRSFHQIVSALHVHLDAHNCLEVLVVKGKGQEIRKIADRLVASIDVGSDKGFSEKIGIKFVCTFFYLRQR